MRHAAKRWWPRVLVAVVAIVAVLVSLSATGVDLPGPPVKRWLGLADEPQVVCAPGSESVQVPDGVAATDGSWTAEPDLPAPEHPELDAAVLDGLVYLVGGLTRDDDFVFRSVDTVLAFDPESDTYEELPPLPTRLDHELTVAHEGMLYVIGGYRDFVPVADVWRYDPAERTWTALPPMRQPRGGLAGAVVDGLLYVVGGAAENTGSPAIAAFGTLEIFDFETGTWTFGPDMPTPRHHFSAVELGGKLYAVGGRTGGDFTLDAFERFDPASGAWEELEPLPFGVGSADAASSGRAVVAIGGGDDNAETGWVTPATWAYVPEDAAWTRLPDLETGRHGHAAVVANGRAFVFGGSPCAGYGLLRSVESLALPPELLP